MAAFMTEFLAILEVLWDFAEGRIIPAAVADITLVHVAIWLPVVLGLIVVVFNTIKGMWSRRGRRA